MTGAIGRRARLVPALAALAFGISAVRAEAPARWCDERGACWQSPQPQGNALTAAWGTSERDLWLVGCAGTILHFDGAKWARAASGTTATLRGLWGSGQADVWAVGDRATVLHFDGKAWTAAPDAARVGLRAVWGSGPRDVWIAGERGALAHFDGTRWSEVASGARETLLALGGTGPGDVFAVGAGGAVLHFDGAGWSRQKSATPNALYGVWVNRRNDVWALSGNGPNIRYDGNGWSPVPRATPAQRFDLFAAWAGPGGRLAIDRCGRLHRIGEGPALDVATGQELALVASPAADYDAPVGIPGSLVGVQVAAECGSGRSAPPVLHSLSIRGSTAFAVGGQGAIWKMGASGWTPLASPVTETLRGVTVLGDKDAWAVGGSARLHWDGRAWSDGKLATSAPVEAVWASAAGDLWFAGPQGTLARRDAKGIIALHKSGTTLPLQSIWGSGPQQVLAAGGESRVGSKEPPGIVVAWDGKRWSRAATSKEPLAAIAGSGPRDIWAAGARGAILHFDGKRWAPSDSGATEDLQSLWVPASGEAWAAGKAGTLLRFAGGRWSRVESGTRNHLFAITGDERAVHVAGMNGTILTLVRPSR